MKMLKPLLLAILLAAGAGPALADVKMLKSTFVGDPGSIVCKGTDAAGDGDFVAVSTTLPYFIGSADSVTVTVYAAVNSTATVVLQTAPTPTGPWFTVTPSSITNPTTDGEQWSIPYAKYVRGSVTAWTAQTIRFCIGAKTSAGKQIW